MRTIFQRMYEKKDKLRYEHDAIDFSTDTMLRYAVYVYTNDVAIRMIVCPQRLQCAARAMVTQQPEDSEVEQDALQNHSLK